MESTLEKIASCRYKTKMDKRSGFWQVDLTHNAQELLAFITPQGRVFKWKVMPFGVANAPALFQELMNKILSILRRRPQVQETGHQYIAQIRRQKPCPEIEVSYSASFTQLAFDAS